MLKERGEEEAKKAYELLKRMGGCSVGLKICSIWPDGSVHPCQFIPEAVGNVREASFKEIWSDSNPKLRPFRDKSLLKGRCGECEFKEVCGGCRARAKYYRGSYLDEDPSCYIDGG